MSSIVKQHFRGVVWPRPELKDKGLYRYIVVGMLVTDRPLENIEGKNEIVLDGHAAGMPEALETIRQKKAKHTLGDATDVLLQLDYLVDEDEESEEEE